MYRKRMMANRLHLLGRPFLVWNGQEVTTRSQKTLLLLAYLALEGPTPRERLAAHLWESQNARGNLRVELYRLEQVAPGAVVRQAGQLALGPCWVDVHAFQEKLEQGRLEEAISLYRGPFLEGIECSLTPEMEEWLAIHRESLQEQKFRVLTRLAETATEPARAITLYRELLHEDPLNEAACRGLMRRLGEQGRRQEALKVYRDYARFLEVELGLPPEPETRALAEAIATGIRRSPKPRPSLVGRDTELATAQRAHAAGLTVFITGEPGIGKSRLIRELVLSSGKRPLLLRGRPGDRSVPYATLARGLRELLSLAEPPDWVVPELARILPELGEPPKGANPARLFRAIAALIAPFVRGGWILGIDDLQFVDPASTHALLGVYGHLPPVPLVVAYRRSTLPTRIAQWVRERIERGEAIEIALGPLDTHAVSRLLSVHPRKAAQLARYTGGNPFFLLQLAEEKRLSKRPPRRVYALIQGRLAEADPLARRLAELATLAGEDFSMELAAELLGERPLAVAEASDRLERLGLFRKGRPAHDLVVEAIADGLAPETAAYWHRRLAEALEDRAPEARIAEHYQAAGAPGKAARWWFAAAKRAEEAFAYAEALALYQRALEAAPQSERDALEIESFVPRYRLHLALADWEGAEALLDRAERLARQRGVGWLFSRALLGRADLAFRRWQLEEALERTETLLASADLDADARAHACYIRAVALQAAGKHREALRACREALKTYPSPDWSMRGWVKNTIAISHLRLGSLATAREENQAALAFFRQAGDRVGEANALRVFAEIAAEEGREAEARRLFDEALAIARRTDHQIIQSFVLAAAVRYYQSRGDHRRARALAAEGRDLEGPYRPFFEAHF